MHWFILTGATISTSYDKYIKSIKQTTQTLAN